MDAFVLSCRAARSFKHGNFGFRGGLDENHEYTVKHCARCLLIELSVMLVVSGRGARAAPAGHPSRRETGDPLNKPESSLVKSPSSSDVVAVTCPSSSAAAPAPSARRLASALPLRPEEIAAGYEISSFFFDVSLSRIQAWCPLEESELLEPFKEETGRWAYDVFGVNPCFLGCLLCLTSGIAPTQRESAQRAEPRDILKEIRTFYKEVGQMSGRDRDAVFAPGARVIWQKLRPS